MNKHLFLFLFLVSATTAGAQEQLEADRPGETRSPELVKGNNFQAEMGFRKEKVDAGIQLYEHPTATLRYGLFNAIELRAEIISQTVKNTISKDKSNGLKPVEFGIKGKILPESKGFPSLALLGLIGVPKFSSEDYYDGRLPVEVRALFGNTISKKIKLQYNAGVKWADAIHEAQWLYTFSPVYEITDKAKVFIEQYAFLGKNSSAEHYFDGGFEYYVSNNWMLDLSAGVGLSNNSSPYFVAAGTSFRISVR